MNYSLSDSLRFVRYLTPSDLDSDNPSLLHVISAHLENLRNSNDPVAKELLKDKASALGEWIELNPEDSMKIQLAKEDEDYELLVEEKRHLRKQVELVNQWNEQAILNEKMTALERENRGDSALTRQREAWREQEFLMRYEVLTREIAQKSEAVKTWIERDSEKYLQELEKTYPKEKVQQAREDIAYTNAMLDKPLPADFFKGCRAEEQETLLRSEEARKTLIETVDKFSKGQATVEDLSEARIKSTVALEIERQTIYLNKEGTPRLMPLERKQLFDDPHYQKAANALNEALKKFGIDGVTDPKFAEFEKSPQFKTFLKEGSGEYNMTGAQLIQQLHQMSIHDRTQDKAAIISKMTRDFENEAQSGGVGVVTSYALMLNKIKEQFAPVALEEFAVSITKETMDKKLSPKDYAVLRIQDPSNEGKFVEMLIADNDKRYDVLDRVASGYLTSALKREAFSSDEQYRAFVSNYLLVYAKENPTMFVNHNQGKGEEYVNHTNKVFLKLASLDAFAKQHPEFADKVAESKETLETELIAALKENAHDKESTSNLKYASDAQYEQIAKQLINMSGSSEARYAQVEAMTKDYKAEHSQTADVKNEASSNNQTSEEMNQTNSLV